MKPREAPAKSPWRCVRSHSQVKFDNTEVHEVGHLKAVPTGALRLKNVGKDRGWALELTRDVKVGELSSRFGLTPSQKMLLLCIRLKLRQSFKNRLNLLANVVPMNR